MLSLSLVGSQFQDYTVRQPSAVLFAAFRSRSLNWAGEQEGAEGEEGRAVQAGVAIPPAPPLQTSAQQRIQAPVHPTSLQIPEALKLWTKSLWASSIFNRESKRDAQKGWIIPQGLF